MPKLEIDIPHALAPEEARARIARSTGKIESKYGATCAWVSDRQLTVTRKGFDALLTIEANRVHVGMSLGFLLIPMANAIKTGLGRELAALLADGSGGGSGPSTA
jgi:putative polyhydroxyalkanoate system protein